MTVIVYGRVSFDKYSGENIISATAVNTVSPIKKQDTAEKRELNSICTQICPIWTV